MTNAAQNKKVSKWMQLCCIRLETCLFPCRVTSGATGAKEVLEQVSRLIV